MGSLPVADGDSVAGLVRVCSELAVHLLPGETLRSANREGAVDQPVVEVEAQRRAFERREGVHVKRPGVVDDFVKKSSLSSILLSHNVRSSVNRPGNPGDVNFFRYGVLRRLGFRKADSVYDDRSLTARPFQLDRFTMPSEDLHTFRQYKFLGDP